ncbi:hypothetical protein [Pseudomonas oryzihabitans]|uniref:hypothetical protein n=1 Tax=Pseudomonas oryzihabitans TaxID=47885 RepID=UPI00289A2D73|nr:hypothetical protein [Pseudomonas oryzihabitans]
MSQLGKAVACFLTSTFAVTANAAVENPQQRVEKSLYALCPKLGELAQSGDLVSQSSTIDSMMGSIQEDLGWEKTVTISLVLANPAKSLPSEWHANGQTCHFTAGNGAFLISKTPCQRLCGMAPSKRPVLLDAPDLDSLF